MLADYGNLGCSAFTLAFLGSLSQFDLNLSNSDMTENILTSRQRALCGLVFKSRLQVKMLIVQQTIERIIKFKIYDHIFCSLQK